MRAEMMKKHVWRKVSASQSRAADLERMPELAAALDHSDEESNHWPNASQTNTATATMSQMASQT
jgi:hypothetical protein